MRSMSRAQRVAIAILAFIFGGLALTAGSCDPDGEDKDAAVRQNGFDRLQAQQPAVYMAYSPTRANIKFFADTWGSNPNKLAYVYLTNQSGQVVQYYVIKGLPTSYCAQMLPPSVPDWSGSGGVMKPAPAVDGTYYGTANVCNTYYGKDATTGKYVEWTQGTGLTMVGEAPKGRPETDRPDLAGGPTVIGTERR